MSLIFSLLSLNDEDFDKHPRSWICVRGNKMLELVNVIEKEIIKDKGTNREQISKLISKNLYCNNVSIKNILRGKSSFYPIPILIHLCKMSKKEKYYLKIIEEYIEDLKVNSASAKPIRALKSLTPSLSKIVGAFCADGSLSMQFVISSKNKENLEELKIIEGLAVKYSLSRKEFYVSI